MSSTTASKKTATKPAAAAPAAPEMDLVKLMAVLAQMNTNLETLSEKVAEVEEAVEKVKTAAAAAPAPKKRSSKKSDDSDDDGSSKKKRASKKSEDGEEKPKREPNAWIKFGQEYRAKAKAEGREKVPMDEIKEAYTAHKAAGGGSKPASAAASKAGSAPATTDEDI